MAPQKRPREEAQPDVAFRRTLRLVTSVAAQQCFPARVMYGGHPIDGAYLFAFRDGGAPTAAEGEQLQAALHALIDEDAALTLKSLPYAAALAYFAEHDLDASASLLRTRVRPAVDVVELRGALRLALFALLPRAGALGAARPWVRAVPEGILVVYRPGQADGYSASGTLLSSFADHRAWGRAHGASTLGQLNALKGTGREMVDFKLHAEFRQESKLAAIAEAIRARNEGADSAEGRVGVILIAGPTSSGKTTFATKLAMYLSNFGYHAVALSVDHYYLPLDEQPDYQARKERADVDYDSLAAMDVPLVNAHVNALLRGETVMAPVYNMKTGYRDPPGKAFALPATGKAILVRARGRARAPPERAALLRLSARPLRRGAGARGHPLAQPGVHVDGAGCAPLPHLHLAALRAAARRGQQPAHDRPPLAAPHVPRLPLPRLRRSAHA